MRCLHALPLGRHDKGKEEPLARDDKGGRNGARDDKVGSIVRNTGTGPCFGVSLSTNTRASKDAAAYPHGRYF